MTFKLTVILQLHSLYLRTKLSMIQQIRINAHVEEQVSYATHAVSKERLLVTASSKSLY